MDAALKELYYDVAGPGSYGGRERLYRAARGSAVPGKPYQVARGSGSERGEHNKAALRGVTRDDVNKFLADQRAYTLHRPARRHFPRNRIFVGKIDKQWQADLADMVGLQRENGGHRYIFTVIDVFSKFAWALPLKNKDSKSVAAVFAKVLDDAKPRNPERLQTDKGKEFFNKDFAALMKKHHVHHFASESDQKAAVVERFNRTIKTRLWTYLSANSTRKWVDALPGIIRSYNTSFHRSIGMAPEDVTPADQDRIWVRLYGDGDTELKRHRIEDDAKVRISRVKAVFEKGYMPNWSREQFIANALKSPENKRKRASRPVYQLKDESGEPLLGKWYPEELQAIGDNDYEVEKNNSPHTFTTKLARPLLLDGDWEVALIDLAYQHEWYNVPNEYKFAVLAIAPREQETAERQPPDQARPAVPNAPVGQTYIALVGDERNDPLHYDLHSLREVDSSIKWKCCMGRIEAGNYADVDELAKRVDERIHVLQLALRAAGSAEDPTASTANVQFDKLVHRVTAQSQQDSFLIVSLSQQSILQLLGLGSLVKRSRSNWKKDYDILGVTKGDNKLMAPEPMRTRNISSMFIYTDIVEQTLLADSQANVLGVLPVTTSFGEHGYHAFNPPFYQPVRFSEVPTIEIRLCQDTGEPMPISLGKTTCRLHFRRVARVH